MEELKNNRHTLTLIFKEPVSEGIIIILKGQYPEIKAQRKGKTLTLSNIHHENAKDIMFTVKEEEGEFTHTLHRDRILKDTRETDYQAMLLELDNPDIEDLRAATICDLLIRRYKILSYISNNGMGKQYIKDGAICEKFVEKDIKQPTRGFRLTSLKNKDCNLDPAPFKQEKKPMEKKISEKQAKIAKQNEQIKKLVSEGKTFEQMSETTGIAYNTLWYRIKTMGLNVKAHKLKEPCKDFTKSNQKIIALVQAKKCVNEISKLTGLTTCTIYYRLQKLGIKVPRQKSKIINGVEQYRKQIVSLIKKGKTNPEIDDIMKVSRGATLHRLQSLGLHHLIKKRTLGIPKESLQALKISVKEKKTSFQEELDKLPEEIKKEVRVAGKEFHPVLDRLPKHHPETPPDVICERANQCKVDCDHWQPHFPIDTGIRKCTDGGTCRAGFICKCVAFEFNAQKRSVKEFPKKETVVQEKHSCEDCNHKNICYIVKETKDLVEQELTRNIPSDTHPGCVKSCKNTVMIRCDFWQTEIKTGE